MRELLKSPIKLLSLTLLLLFVNLFTVKAQLQEGFDDGDFTNTYLWSGDDTKFAINSFNQLQLNDNAAGSSQLSTQHILGSLDSIEWHFYIKESFSPSGSNNGKVYLTSDQSDLSGSLNGYYLQFGEAGSLDAIELFEQTGTTSSSVCRAFDGSISSSWEAHVRVRRDENGNWELAIDYSGGTNYVVEATGTDVTHINMAFLGVQCNYTSSNSTKFYFDNFYIGGYDLDLTPPTIISVTPTSNATLDVLFNEPVDQTTAETLLNYDVNGNNPVIAEQDGGNAALVHLTFGNSFQNGITETLITNNVTDDVGNAMITSNNDFLYFVSALPNYKDIVINEIYADYSPIIGLPETEYIELFNNSTNLFDLGNFKFSDGTTNAQLNSYILQPNEYVIVCDDDDTALFNSFGTVVTVSTFPSLNNSGDNLTLTDDINGILVDEVNYLDTWYQDPIKQAGGYSLELINPGFACSDFGNWRGSDASIGGTPGTINSVYDNTPDTQGPSITVVYVDSSTQIQVLFNETLDSASVMSADYIIDQGITVNGVVIGPTYSSVTLTLNPAIPAGIFYNLTITNLTDCSGNDIGSSIAQFALPQQAVTGDVIINEVLYKPYTGGSDFVEIYNNSNKVISLEGWKLANYDDDTLGNFKDISLDAILMYPQDYIVLTKDSVNVKEEYPLSNEGSFIQMGSLPSYNSDSGTVYLINNLDEVSDKFSYDDDMQFQLLNSTNGVSLERLDFNRVSSDTGNWHSAAEDVGFATPGYLNSQYFDESTTEGLITLAPGIFSPDNDGFEDVLNINYKFDEPGLVGNVMIYDSYGRKVRVLTQNEFLGTYGTITWDGLKDSNEKVRIGTYIIYFEVFNTSGIVNGYKKTCVVATRLN